MRNEAESSKSGGDEEDLATDAFNKNAVAKKMNDFFMEISSKKRFKTFLS